MILSSPKSRILWISISAICEYILDTWRMFETSEIGYFSKKSSQNPSLHNYPPCLVDAAIWSTRLFERIDMIICKLSNTHIAASTKQGGYLCRLPFFDDFFQKVQFLKFQTYARRPNYIRR